LYIVGQTGRGREEEEEEEEWEKGFRGQESDRERDIALTKERETELGYCLWCIAAHIHKRTYSIVREHIL